MKLYKEDNQALPSFQLLEDSESTPSGFTLTNILQDWLDAFGTINKDYKWNKNTLKQFGDVDDTTWNAYTDDQRYELSRCKAVTTLQRRLDTMGSDYDMEMTIFDTKSRESRVTRYQTIKSILIRNITKINAYNILSVLESDLLENRYIDHGIEGTTANNPDVQEAIFNFIDATPESEYYDLVDSVKVVKMNYLLMGITNNSGTIIDAFGTPLGKYEANGVRVMSMTMLAESTLTQAELVDLIMDCIKGGNY